MMQDHKEQDSTLEALLSINALKYTLPESLSVVTARAIQRYPSLSQDHHGGVSMIYFRAETGARFVDGRNSWIRLQLTVDADTAFFASVSISNCIRTVVIRSASGTELDRQQLLNVKHRNLKRWSCPPEFFKQSMGTLGGWDSPTTDLATGGPQYYYIRLADLSSFFDNPKLIPSMVMSGLQIELELESPVIAFKSTKASGSVSYAINECQLFTDTFQLSDSIARRMNQLAASSGLELSYEASAATFTSARTGQNRFSINANLSVSRALQAFAVSIPNSNLVSTADSFNNDQGTTLDSWQIRVGSSYYPTAQVLCLRDSLIATLHSFDKIRTCSASASSAVDYASFVGCVSRDLGSKSCGCRYRSSKVHHPEPIRDSGEQITSSLSC
jgi:hypothetical protein